MKWWDKHINQPTAIAPLVVFRILFGVMMLVSIVRFALNGWIEELYIKPAYYFTYYGFDWVQPLGVTGMYLLFIMMSMAALGIIVGWQYRLSTIIFFLSFTYVELIDKTNYLNHYYFVSLVSFLMIWLPANRSFSIDGFRKPQILTEKVPSWTINIIKFQLGLVYFYAGIAKLNYEWLFEAMPMKIWLPANSGLPVFGWLFNYAETAYAFSWMGAIYDLSIAFLLLIPATRFWAYLAVVFFHLMTAALFQIGMFPYIMIMFTLIFFSAEFHKKVLKTLSKLFFLNRLQVQVSVPQGLNNWAAAAIGLYIIIQLTLPFRYLLYPGDLFWTEEGYRFSWRVMLMEKAGYTVFNVLDPITGKKEQVANYEYLTDNQEKMMSTQPDMILQFAHYLEEQYKAKGIADPQITAESYVTLNGKRSRLFIDPTIDLTKEKEGFRHKTWILPYRKPIITAR